MNAGVLTSPDNKIRIVVQAANRGQSFEDAKANARDKIPSLRIIDNSGKRYWYEYREPADGGDSPDTHWNVLVARNGQVCAAQIAFKSAISDSLVKQIVRTIRPVR